MSGEINNIRIALHHARRSYHNSTCWSDEHPSGDGTGPTFDQAIDAALDAAEQRIAELESEVMVLRDFKDGCRNS